MIIEIESRYRAEARRHLNRGDIEFVQTPDGFEVDPDHLEEVKKVLEDRLIVYYVNTGEL